MPEYANRQLFTVELDGVRIANSLSPMDLREYAISQFETHHARVVRHFVAVDRRTPPAVLARLARDRDPWVAKTAVENPSCPTEAVAAYVRASLA